MTHSLASLRSFSLFCCFFCLFAFYIHSHSVSHKVRCGVYPSSHRSAPPVSSPLICLSSLCFSPSVSPPLHHLSIFRFSLGLFFTFPLSHISYFFPLNVSLLSLSRLLLTLFIAHTVSPSRSSSSSPLLSPLSLCTPSFILYSWHHVLTLSSPLSIHLPPPLSSSITLAFPGCLWYPFIPPSSLHTSSPPSFPIHFPLHRGMVGNMEMSA